MRRRLRPRTATEAYRAAYFEAFQSALPGLARIAADWAACAVREGDVDEAADAHLRWVVALQRESRRRLFRPERERAALSWQGLAAESGFWLLLASRPREAVVAVESMRAVLLTERLERARPDIGPALVDAGRHDLRDRLLQADRAVGELERAQHGRSTAGAETNGFITPEHRAHAALEQVLREAGQVLGRSLTVDLPSYEAVCSAAAEAPVVYLASAQRTGFALVVSSDQKGDPDVVWLPALAAEEVRARAERFLCEIDDGRRERRPAVLGEMLDWLWMSAMRDIVSALPRGPLVTLVPVGPLGLLPLHAAATSKGGVATAFRYAPNARMLVRSEILRRQLDRSVPQRVLAVDAQAPGMTKLDGIKAETGAVQRICGGRCHRLSDAGSEAVLDRLTDHHVVHFACHGTAALHDPLDSALHLSDGSITLGRLLARPAGGQRLAVLSACKTNVPARGLPDEVVSLPSGFMAAGAAGVVATQWPVADQAAGLLSARFHEFWRDGATAALALDQAQRWLHTRTNGQLHDWDPVLYPQPLGLPPIAIAQWRAHRQFDDPLHWAAFCFTGT
jgi:CHAT domain-containing protein